MERIGKFNFSTVLHISNPLPAYVLSLHVKNLRANCGFPVDLWVKPVRILCIKRVSSSKSRTEEFLFSISWVMNFKIRFLFFLMEFRKKGKKWGNCGRNGIAPASRLPGEPPETAEDKSLAGRRAADHAENEQPLTFVRFLN